MKKAVISKIKDLKKTKGILILGHRGCRKAEVQENTIAAFEKAFDVGSDGIEIDVESTSDNELIVVNRWFLNKKFDFFPWERNFEHIKNKCSQKDLIIPTFDDVCKLIKKKPDSIFNVEIKSSSFGVCKTAKRAVDLIYKEGIEDQVIISSFDMNTLLTVKYLKRNLVTAYLFRTEDRVKNIKDKKSLKYKVNGIINRSGFKGLLAGTDTIHPEISLFSNKKRFFWQFNPLLTRKNINAWTVDNADDLEKSLNNSVDIIISDDPEKMVKLRSQIINGNF